MHNVAAAIEFQMSLLTTIAVALVLRNWLYRDDGEAGTESSR